MPAPQTRDTGRWKLGRPLGSGGQGEVFLASHIDSGKTGVLKRIRRDRLGNDKARVRFLREIGLVNRLKHPSVIRVFEAHTRGEDPWLVTEWAQLGAIDEHVGTFAGDIWRVLRITRDVARAMAACHAAGVIHRDLKPQNILLHNLDQPAVADFGIAHDAGATSVTSSDERVGSRLFSPPERDLGHITPTPAFDIYSLGKIVYYMLAGGRCFPREIHMDPEWDLAQRHKREEFTLINQFLFKTVRENPRERLQSMDEVVQEIDRLLTALFTPKPSVPQLFKLPQERHSVTHRFSIAGYAGTLIVGLYPDGRAGEIHTFMEKEGSVVGGLLSSWCSAVTLGLQHGIPLYLYTDDMKGTRFEPSGFTGNPEIPIATSIMDYVARWLEAKFNLNRR